MNIKPDKALKKNRNLSHLDWAEANLSFSNWMHTLAMKIEGHCIQVFRKAILRTQNPIVYGERFSIEWEKNIPDTAFVFCWRSSHFWTYLFRNCLTSTPLLLIIYSFLENHLSNLLCFAHTLSWKRKNNSFALNCEGFQESIFLQ